MYNPFHKTLQDRVNEDILNLKEVFKQMEASPEEMNLTGIKERKRHAEKQIAKIIQEFMNDTGCRVEDIDMEVIENMARTPVETIILLDVKI